MPVACEMREFTKRKMVYNLRVLDKVRETYPDLELHVFYGIEHLHKWGHAELQRTLQTMMAERPWVKYHGATQQDVLMEHLKEASAQ